MLTIITIIVSNIIRATWLIKLNVIALVYKIYIMSGY